MNQKEHDNVMIKDSLNWLQNKYDITDRSLNDIRYSANEVAEFIDEYMCALAKTTNEAEALPMLDVSSQRELLLAYAKWITSTGAVPDVHNETEFVDEFLASNSY